MAESRRLFFALWPEEVVRQGLLGLGEQLQGSNGRPTHPRDLHVTLVFLGTVEEGRRCCVQAVADSIRARPFELRIDRFGFWSRPRILWCGPGETPQVLTDLVADLQRGLEGCGFSPERRPYAAHLTLARKARRVPLPEPASPVNWPVREFALAASRLGGGKPRYELLKTWSLTEGG
jgi:2'-5' RNA ligase